MNKMNRINSHFIRQKNVPEEGCKGEPGIVRPAVSGLQTNNCSPQLATGGPPGVIQRSRSRGTGRRNGEINKAAAESGVPGFYFTIFMYFMVKLY
jgi:hypothetical protein